MLVDSHCHLDFDSFDNDRPQTIQRAFDSGVGALVTICTHFSKFPEIVSIANIDPRIYCSVGIHPHQVAEESPITLDNLLEATEHPKVIGIGETGLDYYYDQSPRNDQKASFRTHIAAARQTQLPLIVHTRDADDDMASILKEEMENGSFPCVLHCFSSGRMLAETAIELGFYLSLSGILTFKNAEDLREIIRDMPADRLLVETDSPYLAPVPNRGKRNEPSFVVHTAEKASEIKGLDIDTFSKLSTENFFRLFSKAALNQDVQE
ncbi:MAG: LuxR family transcriptional regulator [Rhodospirillaceae bacterium]|nr:LuxR family transcriptional regulator [Rhodospirillaceae bacterium]|tara:strand:+ start:5983 stop:6777 length:795 start_codon:yes stop_codon:yes gene_type:complete